MSQVIIDILEDFRPIRYERNTLPNAGKCSIGLFIGSVLAILFSIVDEYKSSNIIGEHFTLCAMVALLISSFAMIIIADYEPAPKFDFEDLRKVDAILAGKKIETKEERELLKSIIGTSVKTETKKLIGINIFVSLLLSPVYFYVINIILEADLIIALNTEGFVFGEWILLYIEAIIYFICAIIIINIIRIMKDSETYAKKDLLQIIDEIELWKRLNEKNLTI